MATRSLGTLTLDVVAKIGGFVAGMSQAERTSKQRMDAIVRNAKRAGVAIGAAITAAATAAAIAVNTAIDRMDELGKSSQKVGIATDELSKLAYAASLADVEFSALEGALIKLAKAQDAASQGTGDQLALFRALGVEFQNVDGTLRNTGEVFAELADAFQELPDGANKTAAAVALLGRSGAQLIPLMNGGAEGIKAAGDELARFGGVVGPEAAKQAEEFNDNVTRLTTAADGLWQSLASQLLPDLIRVTEKMLDASAKGGDLRVVIEGVATVTRGMGLAAQAAIDGVQGLTFGMIALFNVAQAMSRLTPGNWLNGTQETVARIKEDIREAGVAFDLMRGSFDETGANLFGGGAAPAPQAGSPGKAVVYRSADGKEIDAATAANIRLAKALEEARTEAERAAAAKAAAAEAARAMAEAEREAQRAIEEAARASADFRAQTEDLAADLAGPVAQVQLDYARREKDLIVTAKLAGLSQDELASSLALLTQARERDVAAAQLQVDLEAARLSPYEQLLASMDMELDLMGQTNAQRVATIELERILQESRERGVEISASEQEAMRATIEAQQELLDANQERINALDDFRSSFEDNVAAVLDGSKSIKDAFRDMVDDFIAQLARMAAQNFADSLFGEPGQSGGGKFGDWLGNFFSMFGGGKAAGGPVMSGVPYLVGEQGPELMVPSSSGTVIPAGKTAAMLGGRATVIQNFNMPGRYDLRTQAQVSADAGRATQRALARGTA
jgi:uncharacterized protein YeeX (DUF496 family)